MSLEFSEFSKIPENAYLERNAKSEFPKIFENVYLERKARFPKKGFPGIYTLNAAQNFHFRKISETFWKFSPLEPGGQKNKGIKGVWDI